MPRTQKQLEASRANGRKSRGPVTAEGKARSSQNALTHGLDADTVCLADEDHDAYDQFRATFHAEWCPSTPTAAALVDDLAATRWRLQRALRLESELFDSCLQASEKDLQRQWRDTLGPEQHLALSLDRFERQLDRLQTHIGRLYRQFHRTLKALEQWRKQNEQNEPKNPEPVAIQEPTPASISAPLPLCDETGNTEPPTTTREQPTPSPLRSLPTFASLRETDPPHFPSPAEATS